MAIQLFGHWHLRVTKAIHNWENRFVVQGAASGSGTYPPTVDLDVDVDGASWLLMAEYRESNAVPWKPSEMMMLAAPERVDIQALIGAEDPLPSKDFEDIQWDARYLGGTMLGDPLSTLCRMYRRSLRDARRHLRDGTRHVLHGRPSDQPMGAALHREQRARHRSSEPRATGDARGDVSSMPGRTPSSPRSGRRRRHRHGAWSTGAGAARTVYFKVDVSAAAPRKHEVEFVCRNVGGMADPAHPARRVRKQIFVSRTSSIPRRARSCRKCRKARCASS